MKLIRFLISISPARIVAIVAGGLICGVANTYLVTLINGAISPQPQQGATLAGFATTGVVVLVSGVVSQVLLVRLTQDAIFRLRAQMSSGVLSAPLEHLERLGNHRLLATLTEDVRALSQAVTTIPNFCVDVATIVGCLLFLAVVSGPVFAVTVTGTVVSISVAETLMRRVRRTFHDARENEDALLRSFQAVTAGIKELKLHRGRRKDFMDRHLLGSAGALRDQNVSAGTRLSVAQGFGQLIQMTTTALVLFVVAVGLDLPRDVMVSYILITMFLATPMRNFMQRIPELVRGDVALAKIRDMDLSMRAANDEQLLPFVDRPRATFARLDLTNVGYGYRLEQPALRPPGPGAPPKMPPPRPEAGREGSGFRLGPVDLAFEPGQVSFIVGGNGSGKSTLAKLITGLYVPDTGYLALNGEKIDHDNVEWFRQNTSAIFADFHLFEEYLGFDRPGIDDEVRHYLELLEIADKVTVQDGLLSTIALSQGQRKRLALLTALLDDRQIYVFDEWAADQDPRFREVFYTEILPGLKGRGKTVIVITHDDRYFHCADQIVKLDVGQIVDVTAAVPARRVTPQHGCPPLVDNLSAATSAAVRRPHLIADVSVIWKGGVSCGDAV